MLLPDFCAKQTMHPEYVLIALLIVLAALFITAFLPVDLQLEEDYYEEEEANGREITAASFTASQANSGAESTSMI
jgi:hypothetical protein